MPVVIAQVLRFVVIAIVQSAVFTALLSLLEPLIDKAKAAVKSTFGLSDTDAGTYIANFILDTVELAGLTVVSLKTRFPLKIADKLGLTTRGFTRGALPAKVSTGANAPGAVAATAKAAGTPSVDAFAEATASARGVAVSFVKGAYSKVLAFVGVSSVAYLGFINTLDFAAWDGSAYQNTFQPIFAAFGISPDAKLAKATTISDDVWTRVFNTYKELGAYAINDPYKQQSVIFSKQSLIDLVDKVGAELNAATGSAPAKAVLAATHALVLTAAQSPGTVSTGGGSTSVPVSSGGTSTPSVKVFTGIVSQGVLGSGLTFTARPDDLIESVQDLQDAASNNLAAALAALPSSLSYEIKIVSSVITKDGFKQTGSSQQIISGYATTGAPKYKTVVNKFAVLYIYLMNEKGTRTKVRTVVLGPTNVLRFNPTGQQISGIENTVKSTIITSNPGDITSVVSNAPLGGSSAPAPEASAADPYTVGQSVSGGYANTSGSISYVYTYKGGGLWSISDTLSRDYGTATKTTAQVLAERANTPSKPTGGSTAGQTTTTPSPAQGATPAPAGGSSSSGASSVQSATTLAEFFGARGQPLPSVAERALIYQGFGLGQSSFYTGTAEQNTKMLNALKAHA